MEFWKKFGFQIGFQISQFSFKKIQNFLTSMDR